jgi:succinyl-diaminopimelate desuccinylase
MEKSVCDRIDVEALIGLTGELIRIPSVFDPETGGCEEEVALHVAGLLRRIGFDVVVEEVSPGRPNVIAVLEGTAKGRCLMFECHTDVVSPGDPDAWTHPPFEGKVEGNRIYGRGACDTKGNLAAAILAVQAIIDSGAQFPGRILLGILCDEEGLMLGVKDFVKKGWARDVDAAIICEPVDNRLCITQKGAMRARIDTFGKMCHGAMPLAGRNPIPPMIDLLSAIGEIEREEIKRCGENSFLGYPSITPTALRAPMDGPAQLNVVPDHCHAFLDIRTVPRQSHEKLKTRLQRAVDRVERRFKKPPLKGSDDSHPESDEIRLNLDVFEERPWTRTRKTDPLVKAVRRGVKGVTRKEPIYGGVPGATDGTFLHAWEDIPVVTIGAGMGTVPHQKDEWVDVEQLLETSRIYAMSALEYLKGEGR